MKPDTVIDVMEKLVGPIEPVADTTIDDERYDNLLMYQYIVDYMIDQIIMIARFYYKDIYGSREKAGKRCAEWLDKEAHYMLDQLMPILIKAQPNLEEQESKDNGNT